jgi:hypothetical protein
VGLKYFLIFLLLIASVLEAEESCPIVDLALQEITKVRSLPLKSPIPCKKLSKEEIKAYLIQALNKKVTPEKLELERKVLVALRLIPKDYNYREELISLYTEQVGGFYDPEEEYFGTAAWIPDNLQIPIAIHELTHGLQDQSFNLDQFTDSKLSTDDLLARSALAEGDASISMLLVGKHKTNAVINLEDAEIKNFSSSTIKSSLSNTQFQATPKAIRAMLIFPYAKGAEYTHSLLKKGGWDAVNSKYKDAPQGTAEILGFKVEELDEKSKNALTCKPSEKNSELLYEDTLGALYLAYVLGEDALEKPISDIWNGDRICVYKERQELHLSWRIVDKKNSKKAILKLEKKLGVRISYLSPEILEVKIKL